MLPQSECPAALGVSSPLTLSLDWDGIGIGCEDMLEGELSNQ